MWWRCLADSNRRTRFCRPLTKPLIQGTIPLKRCKGTLFISFLQMFWRNSFFSSSCLLVGVTRLERATTWSQTRCATNCATPRACQGAFPLKRCKSSTFYWAGQVSAYVFLVYVTDCNLFLCFMYILMAKTAKFVAVCRPIGRRSMTLTSVKPSNSGYSNME